MDISDASFGILGTPRPKAFSNDKITILCVFGFTKQHVFDLKRTRVRVGSSHKDNVDLCIKGHRPVKVFKTPATNPSPDLSEGIKPTTYGQRSVSFELLDLEFDKRCEGHHWRIVFEFKAWNTQLTMFQYRYWALPEDILVLGESDTQKLNDITQNFANLQHISNYYFDGLQQINASKKKFQNEVKKLEGQLVEEKAMAMTSTPDQQSVTGTTLQLDTTSQEASEQAKEDDASDHISRPSTYATAGIGKFQINCNGKRVAQQTLVECIAKKKRAT